MGQADLPLHEVVANFVQSGVDHRPWARLLAWQGLTGDDGEDDPSSDAFFAAMVDDVRHRQATGEVDPALDPAYVLLVLFAAAMAPTVLPQVVRRVTGRSAEDPAFLDTYKTQLRQVLAHLTPPD